MAAFVDYRGLLRWIPAPSGPAGIVLNDNFTELADRSGPIHSAAADPDANDDDADTGGNGKFYVWSKWLNTVTGDVHVCTDATATTAVWQRLHYDGIVDPDISNSLTIDSTQILYLPDQADFSGTIIIGDGGGSLSHGAGAEGRYNIAVGVDALEDITTGDSNIAVGDAALTDVTTGMRNIGIGYRAQYLCVDGNYNIALGDEVLEANISGVRNVCIGTRAGNSILGDDNICLGHHAGENEVGSDKLYIDVTDTATPLIYGDFNLNLVKINGDLYIPSDSKKLYFGAGDDAYMEFDGATLQIVANSVTGTDDLKLTAQTVECNGLVLADDKIMFTQVDGNEYIDSLNDGYLDYGATTAHRFNNDVKLTADSKKLYFGAADDASITYDGVNLLISPQEVGTGGLEVTNGYFRVNSATPTFPAGGAGIEFRYQSTTGDGYVYCYDRDATAYKPFSFRGSYVTISPNGIEKFRVSPEGLHVGTTGTAERFIDFKFADASLAPASIWTQMVLERDNNILFEFITPNDKFSGFVFGDGAEAGYIKYDHATDLLTIHATTAIVTSAPIKLTTDSQKLYFGAGDDAYIEFDGDSMNIDAGTDDLELSADTVKINGKRAQASGNFAATGDAQGSTFVVRKSVEHSDAAWYELFLDGASVQLLIASDTVWTFDILLVGTTSGCTKSFGFKIEGIIENDGGTTTILASNVTTLYDTDDTDFDARVTADNATDALAIEVTDATSGGDTVRWVAKVSTVEVSF